MGSHNAAAKSVDKIGKQYISTFKHTETGKIITVKRLLTNSYYELQTQTILLENNWISWANMANLLM